jgi:hypothetical protein
MSDMESIRGITWSIYWKWMLSSAMATTVWVVIFNVFVGLGELVSGLSSEDHPWFAPVAQLLVSLIVSFFVLNYFLAAAVGKSIGGKRLELFDEAAVKGETSHAH